MLATQTWPSHEDHGAVVSPIASTQATRYLVIDVEAVTLPACVISRTRVFTYGAKGRNSVTQCPSMSDGFPPKT
jgi:hypothetical protein